MTALLDATDSQMAALADLVEALQAAETTLNAMHAARDGLLAIAGHLAIEMAKQGDHPDKGDHAIRAVAAEIGAAQRTSDRTMERRMLAAGLLVDLFPTVWAAQGEGRISAAHARVIVDAGSHLIDPDERAQFAAIMIRLAEAESPNRLRPLARRVAERFAPTTVTERHRTARSQRRVWVTDGDDGMAGLHMHGPAAIVHGMFDRLSQMAHALRDENRRAKRQAAREGRAFDADDRTVDEIRADLLADLVLTGAPTGHDTDDSLLNHITARIEITVPVTTLIPDDTEPAESPQDGGTDTDTDDAEPTASPHEHPHDDAQSDDDGGLWSDDAPTDDERPPRPSPPQHPAPPAGSPPQHPAPPAGPPPPRPPRPAPPTGSSAPPAAELDGQMPIDTDTARRLAGSATGWDRVMTHPITGAVLAVDRYRPSEHLRRHLRARDQRCRFPGCGIPARKCDLDHNHAASTGGATCDTNLASFCRRHHVLKHHTPWHVEQLPGGLMAWTSPTGRTYIDQPPAPNAVTFTDTDTASAPF